MKEVHETKPFKEKYRFKELRTYGDTEWIMDNRKKYRQVFDRSETTYIYLELSLYNKKFDIENWDLELQLICRELGGKKREICNLNLNKRISKYDVIAYIREGWGNKKTSSFWKEGKYQWEVYVGNNLIGTKVFWIIDNKRNRFDISRYLKVNDLRLFEGAYDDISNEQRKTFFKKFSQSQTRYIFCVLNFTNHLAKNWEAEFFIKFFNEEGELKTIINRVISVKSKDKALEVVAGFGSNTKGSWSKGRYRIEITFMSKLISTSYFIIGDDFEEGVVDTMLNYKDDIVLQIDNTKDPKAFEKVFKKVDRLVGLKSIKLKIRDHAQYIKFLQLRKVKGFDEAQKININSVFMGNPGTGKTTVARLMGQIYRNMGLLSKGHVHEVDRVDLIGEFIGQTAPKVKEAIKKAKGGILFIDEAYSLARSADDHKDFGREAIEILIKEMSSEESDLAVIVAGYPKQMEQFIESNPGLKSRFKHYFDFHDYLPDQLIEISKIACQDKDVTLNEQAQRIINEIIINAYRDRDQSFGNARFVYDLIEHAKINLGIRVMNRKSPEKLSTKDLSTILMNDVVSLRRASDITLIDLPIDEGLLKEAQLELDQLIGMTNIKEYINELIQIIRYHKLSGKNVLSKFYLHTVFVGNPGTGKTTVARILAKIFKALGILERGHLVETDRQGLVAGFVGQTAIKTSEKIDEAMGGVLFIDEAYSLNNASTMQSDFGNEAIQTILKRMEDDRGRFFLFVAGYPDNMDKFLKANPGFSSRFDKRLVFHDYSALALIKIAKAILKQQGYSLAKKAADYLKNYIEEILLGKNKYFGNARVIRQIMNEVIIVQNVRIASSQKGDYSTKQLSTIQQTDIEMMVSKIAANEHKPKSIGFNS